MAAPRFNQLSPALQDHFQSLLKKWNIAPADVVDHVDTGAIAPATVISGDPSVSHVKTVPFNLLNVQHMKEMVGVPDALFDADLASDRSVQYPPPLSNRPFQLLNASPNNCALNDSLTADEHANIKQAWQAFVVGDSRKIAPRTVDLINAVHFPATMAVAAVQDITVQPGKQLVLGSRGSPLQTVLFGTLQIQPGGSVAFQSPVNLTGSLSEASPSNGGDHNIQIYGPAAAKPGTPGPQPQIGAGGNATKGTTGTTGGKNPTATCPTASLGASNGGTGYTGTQGTKGQDGVSPPPVTMTVAVGTGTYNFLAGGGDGANGGDGGKGGQGGNGGDGCLGPAPCTAQAPGKGGLGGTGGLGGLPGNAAPGSTSYFTFTNTQAPFSTNVIPQGGRGGLPGNGGGGGGPGSGGADLGAVKGAGYNAGAYNLGNGSNGGTGNNSQPGTNAPAGQIFIKAGPPVST
jgi:hypothetical protein